MGYGTHKELMENCRIYQEIYQSQIEGRKEADSIKGENALEESTDRAAMCQNSGEVRTDGR